MGEEERCSRNNTRSLTKTNQLEFRFHFTHTPRETGSELHCQPLSVLTLTERQKEARTNRNSGRPRRRSRSDKRTDVRTLGGGRLAHTHAEVLQVPFAKAVVRGSVARLPRQVYSINISQTLEVQPVSNKAL